MATGIEILDRAIGIAKSIIDTKLENVKLLDEISGLYQQLIDVRTKFLELQEENISLKESLKQKDDLVLIGAQLQMTQNGCLLEKAVGRFQPGYYCSACFEDRGKMIRLNDAPPAFKRLVQRTCPSCNAHY